MKGAAASAARPSGASPSRRATVGSNAPTSAVVVPMPTATDRSRARLRHNGTPREWPEEENATRYLETNTWPAR